MFDKKEIFADDVGHIHFAGNMVCFDFLTFQLGVNGKTPVPQSGVFQKNEPAPFKNKNIK